MLRLSGTINSVGNGADNTTQCNISEDLKTSTTPMSCQVSQNVNSS